METPACVHKVQELVRNAAEATPMVDAPPGAMPGAVARHGPPSAIAASPGTNASPDDSPSPQHDTQPHAGTSSAPLHSDDNAHRSGPWGVVRTASGLLQQPPGQGKSRDPALHKPKHLPEPRSPVLEDPVTCAHCPYTTIYQSHMALHERMHGASSSKPFACSICDFAAGSEAAVRQN